MGRKKKISGKMSDAQYEAKLKKYFNGSAPRSNKEQAKDCVFYKKLLKDGVLVCSVLDRENCLGCSFYRTEEVEE